ncbi:hypothetical protein HPO96_27405 [Kribbella sandramycini]|uniref:23S rRNA G2445 N2-methylase RlmL n=1 Tax=Kribbella sandramycini TaxID=60450 RepID=A0A7Y4P186_9ACTN|nr:hypothetical protein [Kribbella sandramycini]MBB6570851.1 23S rRNA G2445 N2-methylase RlmL [Kribbella sandramycini]NOL43982.1 hypothetical protein [Kribbella sandramycini]
MPLVLVRTVSGLERLTAEELAAAGHHLVEVSKRQLIVELSAELLQTPPRLADDLFVVRAVVADPGRTKAGLQAAVAEVDAAADGVFAVSASFNGSRNFSRFDIEDLIGAGLGPGYCSRRAGIRPPTDRTDWRVVLDGKAMWVAERPYFVPLHRRPWRQQTVVGSLHPPVAAAMARLAGITPDLDVLDPFCGAGTLLLEAHAVEPAANYLGIDRELAATKAAQANGDWITWRRGHAAGVSGEWDRVLTNPPWNVRVGIGALAPYAQAWGRVLRGGGVVVALLAAEQVAELAGWEVKEVVEVAAGGRHPRIVVLGQWG